MCVCIYIYIYIYIYIVVHLLDIIILNVTAFATYIIQSMADTSGPVV